MNSINEGAVEQSSCANQAEQDTRNISWDVQSAEASRDVQRTSETINEEAGI